MGQIIRRRAFQVQVCFKLSLRRWINQWAQSHKLTRLLTVKHPYSHHPYCCFVYIPCTTHLHIPLAHPSCSYYYLLSPSILFFAHRIVLHFLFHCTFFSYFSFLPYALVLLLLYYFYFYYFALSTERTWFHLHFTSDYTLYNLLCDK